MRWIAVLTLVAGCGEPALCTRDVSLSLSVAGTVTADLDPVAAGVQTTVSAITTFDEGAQVDLEILDGQTPPASTMVSARVDAAGVASFGLVTVPQPVAHLTASASDVCGEAEAKATVDVLAGSRCDLALVTAPVSIARYAPFGVLNRTNDGDATQAGEQATVAITARVGWITELKQRSALGEESMGVFVQASEVDAHTTTFREGGTSVFAICRESPFVLTSSTVDVFVDSLAPLCSIDQPIRNGNALSVGARTTDTDVDGELGAMTVTPNGSAPIQVGLPAIVFGQTRGQVSLPPGTTSVEISFSSQDHAHNPCAVSGHFGI